MLQTKDILKLLAWEVVNPFILRLKRWKRYKFDTSYKGSNLGCGLSNPSNWVGIDSGVYVLFKRIPKFLIKWVWRYFNMSDIYTFESYFDQLNKAKIIHYDLQYGIPFDDDTVPSLYSSHFFEHLFKKDAVILLKACLRVLKPGGLIRICVPSPEDEISKIKEAITSYENDDISKIQKYVTSECIGFNNIYKNHRYMYSFLEMQTILAQAGFENISEKQFGVGSIPDVKTLDTRDGLFVEAMKSLKNIR